MPRIIMQATLNPALIQAGMVGMKGIQRALSDFYRAYGKDPDLYMEPRAPIRSPVEELMMFNGGDYVSPVMGEDIQGHIMAHTQAMQDPIIRPEVKAMIGQHLQETYQLAQQVQMAQQLAQQRPQPPPGPQSVNAQQGRQAPQPNSPQIGQPPAAPAAPPGAPNAA